MSRHKQFKPDPLKTYPLESRKSKVSARQFARPLSKDSFSHFIDSLPDLLAGNDLRRLAERIRQGRGRKRALIWGFGGHVIKVGLGSILIDLMQRDYVTALTTNGSGMIHDFEIACAGHTSEDVEQQLKEGRFGTARETGEFLNQAICRGALQDKGIGESVGEFLEQSDLEHPELSVFLQAHKKGIPCAVHLASGTDILHIHPDASGEALGKGSQIDFRIFAQQVSRLHGGGAYLNLGSAVILPEVFLKAVAMIRNNGRKLENFTTANLDFIQHYRPVENVLRRPVSASADGIALTGHHELLVPLLAGMLVYGK